ncbi:MAG: isoprenylcysteine carboxylmethyltransferase family protein [Deltaproteobacteria bacterium]|nr:isoprenylcysteine carboxylmethyltransferase family protein [Deltaproteobacteria bacterium]MBW2392731.1 isoprenylcysteine carboxylmethyltransferase family protein [Deltaproteobacteria bacterium]
MSANPAYEIPVTESGALPRSLVLAFGVFSYVLFLGVFLYLIGFIGGFIVPKTLDSGVQGPVFQAVLINLGLLGLFAVQHTIMARSGFKKWLIRFIPAATERSLFVLVTNLILIATVWQWRPLPGVLWEVEGVAATALWTLFFVGWGIVLLSTFLIDHFDLFGLKQTFFYATGRPYAGPEFKEHLLYKVVRHPLMLGFLVTFWAAPVMTMSRFFFAAVCTGYILLALYIEERTLVELHGDDYRDYQQRVRMLIPVPK